MERAFNFNRRQRARDEKKGNENEKKKILKYHILNAKDPKAMYQVAKRYGHLESERKKDWQEHHTISIWDEERDEHSKCF